ncbi:MAG: hypothetical protein M3321_02645, partial [Actinomycetota bacterium]|nr:hypothetical protein [Actinomycetota bacterium]
AERVHSGAHEDAFAAAARADLLATDAGLATSYERVAPLAQSYVGLRRYWDKRATSGGPA